MERKGRTYVGNARKQILTALIATVPTFIYGVQIGWLSPMASQLTVSVGGGPAILSPSDVTWLAAALPLSAILGIPFFSYASDRFGRKYSIMCVSLLSCISWILKLTAYNPAGFIVARVIAGLASGGCLVIVPLYIKEISEDAWRGSLGSLVMAVCKIGVIFVYALGMSASYSANQAVYLAVSAAHVGVFYFMPESPNYLVKTDRDKEAAKTIAWLRGLNRYNTIVTDEITRLKDETRSAQEMPRMSVMSIVRDRPTFAALRMVMVLMGAQTLSGCFALMNYAADVFRRAGTAWSPNTLALFMGSLQLAGSCCTTVSIDKFGRKVPLFLSALIVSICMTTLATCLLLEAGGVLPVVAVCVSVFAYGAGLAPVPFVVMAEVFSFELRARMAGVTMAFSFLCSSMTVLYYTPVSDALGPHVVFYTFGAVGLLGAVYTALWVPETRGKSLEQIREYWLPKREPTPSSV